jgi:hypothetical protein
MIVVQTPELRVYRKEGAVAVLEEGDLVRSCVTGAPRFYRLEQGVLRLVSPEDLPTFLRERDRRYNFASAKA